MVAQVGRQTEPPLDYVSGDMTRAQICEVFASLRFPGRNSRIVLELDGDVARFLVGILQRR
jgi:hypothetical protein